MMLPKVSFLSPLLNEAHRIEAYLGNIREQDYPQHLIEIVIADGGSTDKTVDIAMQYNCRIIENPDRFAEPGLVRCEEAATGELMVVMAADNRMPRKDWLKLMTRPFIEGRNIWGAYTHIEASPADNSFNRYYSLLHVEPFTWFIYGDAVNPKHFGNIYKVMEARDGYTIYSFNAQNHPLIAFAQGFMLRREFRRNFENRGDDILPFIQMIEEGRKIAYVPDAGILHLHLNGYRHYIKKYRGRIINSLYKSDIGFINRTQYLSLWRRIKKYLWLVYGCTLIGPLFDSIRWYFKDKEKCWFWHVPASVTLSYLIVYEVICKSLADLLKAFSHK